MQRCKRGPGMTHRLAAMTAAAESVLGLCFSNTSQLSETLFSTLIN